MEPKLSGLPPTDLDIPTPVGLAGRTPSEKKRERSKLLRSPVQPLGGRRSLTSTGHRRLPMKTGYKSFYDFGGVRMLVFLDVNGC